MEMIDLPKHRSKQMQTIDLSNLSPTTLAYAREIQRRGEIPEGQAWPVQLNGERTYLSYEDMGRAAEELIALKVVRRNPVSGRLVWRKAAQVQW